MLKSLSKPMRLLVYVGGAIIIFLIVQPMLSPSTPPAKKAAPPMAKSNSKNADLYTKEDHTAKFSLVSESAKDVFKPIISASKGSAGTAASSQVNVVPPEFAGGEPNWTYNGSAQVD